MAQVLFRRLTWRSTTLILMEQVLIVAAIALASMIRLGVDQTNAGIYDGSLLWRALLIAIILQLCLHYCDLYDFRTLNDRRELFVGLVQALGAASLLLAVLYYWIPKLIIGRGVFVVGASFIITLVAGWRLTFEWLSLRVVPRERLLIIGASGASLDLARELHARRQELGVDLVGFVEPEAERVGQPVINPSVIGTVADIPTIVRDRRVDRVVVSLADARGKLSMDQLLLMKIKDGVNFDHLASVYERYTGKIALENLRPSWFIFSSGFTRKPVTQLAKRTIDITAAAVGLVVAAPIMAIVALAVRLSSPGLVLYHQQRVGQHGRAFTIHKFRSMRQDAEASSGAVWATKNDARVTPVGRFLRKSRLDELPQLWNVMRGDMSLVGPRPERPEFVEDLTRQIPFYGQRHVVKPGLTGWAQTRYAYGASIEDSMEKLQYDLFYVKHLSLALDFFIMFETLKIVIQQRGS